MTADYAQSSIARRRLFEAALSGCAARSGRAGRVRHGPQIAWRFEGLKAVSQPPFAFLAGAMQFAMMRAAERDRKFIADLLRKSARLRKAQMVRVAGLAAADETGLFGHKAQMLLVPQPLGLRQGQYAFVDAGAGLVFCRWLDQVRLARGPASGIAWSRTSRA